MAGRKFASTGEPAVGAGALHADTLNLPVPAGPGDEVVVAGRRGRDRDDVQQPAEGGDGGGGVDDVGVGVHANDEQPVDAGGGAGQGGDRGPPGRLLASWYRQAAGQRARQ